MDMENFKWYRKLQGGTWYYVRHRTLQDAMTAWVRFPNNSEDILETERYE